MKRIKVITLALLIGVLAAVSFPVEAQNVTNAVVIQALNAMGLFGTGYANGQVPIWSTASRRYLPGAAAPAYPLISPSFTGQMTGAASTCAAPSYSKTGNLTTGLAITATPSWILCVGGASVLTGTAGAVTVDTLKFDIANADTILVRDAANTLALKNGTNGQTFRVYGTTTGTSYLSLFHNGIGTAALVASNASLFLGVDGALWKIADTTGHLLAVADNTYDIGASGATRPRTGYFGTSVVSPILQGSGTGVAVANVGANSCGTTAATIAGNQLSGVITVGSVAGTQCRVTFTTAAPVARDCTVTDSTTTIATRATVVDTTNTDFFGAFVAGDKVTYHCLVR